MKERAVRVALLVLDLFVAASAIIGAVGLVVGFMDIPPTELNGTPFADFTVPALLLGVVVGGSALVAAVIGLRGPRRIDALASGFAGCVMVTWMTVEIAMVGLDVWVQAAYLVIGVAMIALAGFLELAKPKRPSTLTASHRPA